METIIVAVVGAGGVVVGALITAWLNHNKTGGEASESYARAAREIAEQYIKVAHNLDLMTLKHDALIDKHNLVLAKLDKAEAFIVTMTETVKAREEKIEKLMLALREQIIKNGKP